MSEISSMTKKELRKHFKDIRLSADPNARQQWDRQIFYNLSRLDEFVSCTTVLTYVSGEIEVATKDIIKSSIGSKVILCPRCVKNTNIMEFYRINSLDDLESGSYGIKEPSQGCELYESFENSVCIIPGLSFDIKGYRLGFGKGYYDRFLSRYNGVKIGLCYECCISSALPADEFDVDCDIIITESRVIRIKKG